MKTSLITFAISLLFINGFSQNPKFKYSGRFTPSVKKEKLNKAGTADEIVPRLWNNMVLPDKVYLELDKRRKSDYSEIFNCYRTEYNYKNIVDYISVEILATSNGEVRAARNSGGNILTMEQRSILSAADLGSDISIKIRFKLKKTLHDSLFTSKIIDGEATVTVVPETEAEYPGGFKQMTEYLTENFIDKVPGKNASEKIRQAIVKFTVNGQGQVINVRIAQTSTDTQIDNLLLSAISKMPDWKPAENKGVKVSQEFSIPFGGKRTVPYGEGC